MENSIHYISIIGYGNVGTHLSRGFDEHNIHVTHLLSASATSEAFSHFTHKPKIVSSVDDLPVNQLVLLCVPDDKISGWIDQLPEATPVAYTSGSVGLPDLPEREKLGVFYPLQTFSKNTEVPLFEVPFFIEAKSEPFASELFNLARTLSRKVTFASSEQREKLHLAAVWVNNFTNHMNHVAYQYLEQYDLSFDHLRPLLSETARKLQTTTPYDAQTGPARRNDKQVIAKHLKALSGTDREMYALISRSIIDTYQND